MSNRQLEICGLRGTLEIRVGGNSENCKAKENGAKASSSPVSSGSEQGRTHATLTLCFNEHALHLNMYVLDMFLPNIEYSGNQTLAKRTKYQILQSVLTASNDHKRSFTTNVSEAKYPVSVNFAKGISLRNYILLFWVVMEVGYEGV